MEVTNKLKNELLDRIKNELIPFGFLQYLESPKRFDMWREDQKISDVKFLSGATKACVHFKNSDWIIKTGFSDYFHMEGDYCYKEWNNFNKAFIKGIPYFFAPIYFIGTIEERDFYIQPFLDLCPEIINEKIYDYTEKIFLEEEGLNKENINIDDFEDEISSLCSDADDEDVIMALFENDENINELLSLINELNINDLHDENFCLDRNGKIVIIDYSGF